MGTKVYDQPPPIFGLQNIFQLELKIRILYALLSIVISHTFNRNTTVHYHSKVIASLKCMENAMK